MDVGGRATQEQLPRSGYRERKEKLLYVFVGWARFFAHVFVNAVTAWAKKHAHPTRMLLVI